MKLLLGMMERLRPLFEEGGKLHLMKPVFEATVNFHFAPKTRTDAAPHVRDPLDVKRYMSMVIVALAPCVAASVYLFGLRVLAMIAISYAAGGIIEVVFAVLRKEEINEGFLVTGLIFPLILPPALPLWMVAVAVMFGVLVGKELFGGTGRNLFNPALVARCFLLIGYGKHMSGNWIKPGWGGTGRLLQYVSASQVDAMSGATPLAAAKTAGTEGLASLLGDFPLSDMFLGRVPGSMGETSALLIVAGGLFLLITRVANWRTVAGTLGSFALLGAVLHHMHPEKFGPVGWQLCAGGLLFGAFFMATDPVTSPFTKGGKWAYGIVIGVLTLLIRGLTGYVEGIMFAILIGNIAAPLLDEVAVKARLRRLAREG